MRCTVQWGGEIIDDEYVKGCSHEAVYEVRQNYLGKDKDGKTIKLPETYLIGYNCEKHVPKRTAAQYVIEELNDGNA